nr:unnamed protein product [Callosobruchus chinensis]
MAIANSEYEIIYCFGSNGRISDGGVLNNTKFYEKLKSGKLTLPSVFVGYEAFSLGEHLLKPFPQRNLSKAKAIYNYRLSRARRIIENVFGILAARFRIFHTAINVNLETIEKIVMACYVLHIFLRSKCPNDYTPTEHLDHENNESGGLTIEF